MDRTCTLCQQGFIIEDRDLQFYDKVSPVFAGKKYPVPSPVHCPDCRQQRRLAFRNERKVYNRTCSLCQKSFISIYSPDKKPKSGEPLPVYCNPCWWSDSWDQTSYGRDYDFSRSFFEQWHDLWESVPKLGLIVWGDGINSDYTNDVLKCVNSYLVFDGEQAKDCYYGETFHTVRDCIDFLCIKDCELNYETINCTNCYHLQYSRFCENCSDSYFLIDCIGCKNCFGCTNLHQKQYYIYNKPYSKEDYERIIRDFQLGKHSTIQSLKPQIEAFFASQPKKAFRGRMNENSTGNNINNCQNTSDSFDSNDLRDCRFCTNMLLEATDCYDVDIWGNSTSLIYNSAMIGVGCQQMIGGYYTCFDSHDIYHSAFCWQGCSHIFGSVGLKHKQYCILNKQYSKEEYETLVPRIIEQMIADGEWAQFFPPELSPFGYNETVAQELQPITKEQAIKKGFNWSDYEAPRPAVKQTLPASELPDDIKAVTDDILDFAISCEVTGKLFRIVKPELNYYRQQNIPLPHRHPDQRHTDRQKLRPPRHLWSRTCSRCQTPIMTPYAPERPEAIVCEQCYGQVLQ